MDSRPSIKELLAVALSYEREKNETPHLAAKGKGYIAQQIIDIARENNIEIREDADLVQLLGKLDVGSPIPFEAYAAVAEILAYIYRKNDAMKKPQ